MGVCRWTERGRGRGSDVPALFLKRLPQTVTCGPATCDDRPCEPTLEGGNGILSRGFSDALCDLARAKKAAGCSDESGSGGPRRAAGGCPAPQLAFESNLVPKLSFREGCCRELSR